MSSTSSAAGQHTRLALAALALLAACGLAAGWLLPPAYSNTIDQVRAVLDPVSMGAIGIGLIHLQVKQGRASVLATLLCCCSFVLGVLSILRH